MYILGRMRRRDVINGVVQRHDDIFLGSIIYTELDNLHRIEFR